MADSAPTTHLLLLLLSLVFTSLTSIAIAISLPSPTRSFWSAETVLADSGYLSMALTLQLTASTLRLDSPTSATIFAPSDASFVASGQMPLRSLHYHVSPIRLTVDALRTLPYGTPIPTALLHHPLFVTTVDAFSINNVQIDDSAVYDDGFVVIYGTEEFLNSSFRLGPDPANPPELSRDSKATEALRVDLFREEAFLEKVGAGPFGLASDLLRSRGFSTVAAFLDLQILPVTFAELTVFAPVDEAFGNFNFSGCSEILRRHVVPRVVVRRDLAERDEVVALPTFSRGFSVNVTGSGGVLLVNGVPVTSPEMYYSNWLVVHGVDRLLVPVEARKEEEAIGIGIGIGIGDAFSELEEEGKVVDSFSEMGGENVPDYAEYGAP